MKSRDILIMAILFIPSVVTGQQVPPQSEEASLVKLRELLDRSTESFQISMARTPDTVMTTKPVLRWANNERDSQSVGVVVFWLDRGQPAAAMATYNWMGNIYHEFDLLSRESLIAKQDGVTIWLPKTGLKFQAIPDAPEVEMNAVARLRQMKVLAEQFNATMMGWRADRSDRAELRRLPRELYRYQPEKSDVIDGATFAFAMGTDPEALLLIEAVKVKDKVQPEWQYAFVRQTSGELEARHRDRLVWSADRHGLRSDPLLDGISIPSRLNLKTELAK